MGHIFLSSIMNAIIDNKLLLCKSENSDIACWNRNNSEWGFSVSLTEQNLVSLKKTYFLEKTKKAGGLFFVKKTGFSQPCF